ncbi:hypothetical protein SSCG_05717 [Streptomyces clavuligerus]|nr:hypothetical protein SSCG_05717 [Streptomyces clavuligerus]
MHVWAWGFLQEGRPGNPAGSPTARPYRPAGSGAQHTMARCPRARSGPGSRRVRSGSRAGAASGVARIA